MINFDPSRLHQLLLNTGLQNKDNPLYQTIKQIIDALTRLTTGTNENSINIQNNSTIINTSSNGSSSNRIGLDETIIIEENYHMSPSTSNTSVASATYDAPLTNGDIEHPEIIFDSFGEVIMVTGLPL